MASSPGAPATTGTHYLASEVPRTKARATLTAWLYGGPRPVKRSLPSGRSEGSGPWRARNLGLLTGAPAPLGQCPEQSDRIVLATSAWF